MEHDKWIRKLVAILVEMGFEPQAPQAHRKFVYRGDKCKHEVNLVIQSHARESSKKAIVGYVKRTLREAGADMEMISKLDKLAFGFIADGLSIDEIDDALFAALNTNDTELAAEIGIELGKAIIEQGADSYSIRAFNLIDNQKNTQSQVRVILEDVVITLKDIFRQAFAEHLNRHGSFEIFSHGHMHKTSSFDQDVLEKYSFAIISEQCDEDEFSLSGCFIGDLASTLAKHDHSIGFEAVFANETGDDYVYFTEVDDFSSLRMKHNLKISTETAQSLKSAVDDERLIIFMR